MGDPERELFASDVKKAMVKRDMESLDKLYSWKGVHEIHRDQEWMTWELQFEMTKDYRFVGIEWVPVTGLEESMKEYVLNGNRVRNRIHKPNLVIKGGYKVTWEKEIKVTTNAYTCWLLVGKDEEGKWRGASITVEEIEGEKD